MPQRIVAAALVASLAWAGIAWSPGAVPVDPASAAPQVLAPVVDADGCVVGTNTQLIAAESPAIAALGAAEAWTLSKGDGVVVAVVDSGVDATNPHLFGVVLPGINLVPDGADAGGRVDLDGHGTSVASVIAGQRVEGSGVVGFAPGARILPVRVYRDQSQESAAAGLGPDIGRLAEGIRAAAQAGATIINVSISNPAESPELADAVIEAQALGALVVASAGNRGTASDKSDGLRYPAAQPGVIGVAALNAQLQVDDSSIHGAHVDLAAPGAQIVAAFPGPGDCVYGVDAAHTSYATPYVSATAALIAARYPDETPAQWTYRMEATAGRPVPEQRDDLQGWGAIQPYDALVFVDQGQAPGPISPVYPPSDPDAVVPLDLDPQPALDAAEPSRRFGFGLGLAGIVTAVLLGLAGVLKTRGRSDHAV